jgi:hypothetical protein
LLNIRAKHPQAHSHTIATLLNRPGVTGQTLKPWLPWLDEVLGEFND